ncbi:hypothetical protein GQ53DRAFT_773125 [Thozetella sp. PMI_491]|nr:hypothetical protein GQ53DRAFT_773125 [Thozetella sp. PMI_491]
MPTVSLALLILGKRPVSYPCLIGISLLFDSEVATIRNPKHLFSAPSYPRPTLGAFYRTEDLHNFSARGKSLQSWFMALAKKDAADNATATTGQPDVISIEEDELFPKRDIATEAYEQALRYLEHEFNGNAKALAWVRTATSTSLEDLLETTQTAEAKYAQTSESKHRLKSWVRGLSKRIMYYGQVLDMLSQHHPEYVSLVWGAVKFVLMGIISHENLFNQFAKALHWIAQVLPRCELSADLYRTDEMKDAVASLYAHILLFLQQAIKWYNVGPAGRALTALFKPFELSYQETVDQIMLCAKAIDDIAGIYAKVEIRDISVLLQDESRKLTEREQKLHDMQVKFSIAQAELSAAVGTILQIVSREIPSLDYDEATKERLADGGLGDASTLQDIHLDMKEVKPRIVDIHFNQILGTLKPKRSPQDALQKHRALIRSSSPWRSQNRDKFEILQSIGEWVSSPRSSLLVLQTQPRAQARVKEVATELIDLLQPQSKKVIWYLSSTSFEDRGSVTTVEVLKSLIFQSMKLAPELVGAEPANFNTAKLHASHSEAEWLDLLCCILRCLKTCFLIVEAEDVFGNAEEAKQLVEVLLSLIHRFQDTETTIKLLVANYGDAWSGLDLLGGLRGQILVMKRETPVPPRRRRAGARSVFRKAGWSNMVFESSTSAG